MAANSGRAPVGGEGMRSFLVGIAVAGALSACSNSNDVSDAAKLSLDKHQAQWSHRAFSTYEFDLVQQKLGTTSDVHVAVNGSTIESVIDNTTHQPPIVDAGYVSVDDLFTMAQAAFTQKNSILQMEFNEQYGYPTLITISSNDPGSSYSAQLSKLTPSP
jgi:hypothetical protein